MATRLSLLKQLRKDRFTILAAFLLIAQAIIPNGFMPVFAKDGPTIMLCTGQGLGLQTAALPDDASAAMIAIADALDDEHPPETDTTPCDYAAASSPATFAPALSSAPTPVLYTGTPYPRAAHVAIGMGLAAPPPPQTGPPLTF